jgi:hypothetical protein
MIRILTTEGVGVKQRRPWRPAICDIMEVV